MKNGIKYALWFIVILFLFRACEACVGCTKEADRTFKKIDQWQQEREKRESEAQAQEEVNKLKDLTAVGRAIDLGLPSGTLWAEWNLGATKPEGYGEYFAWGETTGTKDGKKKYAWSTYKLCDGGNPDLLSKYHGIFDKDVLELEDDAAYVNWGEGWQIPSDAQFYELMRHCSWQPIERDGVKGYLVSSKSNTNAIFLPMSGYIDDDVLRLRDIRGYYWSRKLDYSFLVGSGKPHCLILEEDKTTINSSRVERYEGISIRPVRVQETILNEIEENNEDFYDEEEFEDIEIANPSQVEEQEFNQEEQTDFESEEKELETHLEGQMEYESEDD